MALLSFFPHNPYNKSMNIAVNLSNPFVLVFVCGSIATFLINHFLEFIDWRARAKNGGSVPQELQKIPLAVQTFDTQKLKNIRTEKKDEIMKNAEVKQFAEDFNKKLDGKGRLLLRKSGTEPLIRIMVEAESDEMCDTYITEVEDFITKYM